MSRTEEVFMPALEGKKIPIISLDNKWYQLMNGLKKTEHMQKLEDELKELLKKQGKLNTECKDIKRLKTKLMNDIVGAIDSDDAASTQEENKKRIAECNDRLEQYQDELLDLPKEIDRVNYDLMLETMELCYQIIQDNTSQIEEISDWIKQIRIELKKNLVKKQECEIKTQEMYSYMHDIFGPQVIDIFDLKYNPGEEHVVHKKKEDVNES